MLFRSGLLALPVSWPYRPEQTTGLAGGYDLRTLTLLPHSPRYLTFHEFDAEYVDKKPKVFLRFLEDVSGGDPEIICRIVEVMGYLFSGINRRCFFVAGTAPCSGKSTLGLLLQALVGEEQVSSISTYSRLV